MSFSKIKASVSLNTNTFGSCQFFIFVAGDSTGRSVAMKYSPDDMPEYYAKKRRVISYRGTTPKRTVLESSLYLILHCFK